MADRFPDTETPGIPPILSNSTYSESALHQEFIFRHIDFLIDVLTAQQHQTNWLHPAGCPTATPEIQCRRRDSNEQFPCRYEGIEAEDSDGDCRCNDVLLGSDDPLDTVAAVVIANNNQPPAQRYFDTEYRQIISHLREIAGTWDEIAELNQSELKEILVKVTNRRGISNQRLSRFHKLLEDVSACEKTDGVTLRGLGRIPYSNFADLLASFPGISRSDAWWLMLVAFEKPVWPTGPFTDGLLCSLGLLSPDRFQDGTERREALEDELSDRQIPQLHRALAGHAVKGGIDVCCDTCEIRKFLLTHRLREQQHSHDQPVVIDLFSGAGGLSLGFTRAGWSIELALDNSEIATDTYRLNHPEIPHRNVICGDIREEMQNGIIDDVDTSPDVIVGGPPCQSLSLAGYRARLSDNEDYSILDDDRTDLYQEYVSIVQQLNPKAIVMENVQGMANEIGESEVKVADLVVEALESTGTGKHGYVCDYRLIDCSNYGIPQERDRVFIFGVREDLANSDKEDIISELFKRLSDISTSEEFNLKQALSGVPKIRRGEGNRVITDGVRGTRSEYVDKNDLDTETELCFNHQAREHPMEKDRTLFDEALDPGDTGWDVKHGKTGEYADLIEYDVGTKENPRFADKYRMLRWTDPAPTVVAHLAKDANNFVLPDYYDHASNVTGEPDNQRNRGITPREAARIQSFTDDHIFLGPFTSWFEQIGNAVPPLIGERIARVINQYLNSATTTKITQQVAKQANSDD
jgi:DNA (cytosine-5)-methyltransferase 1